MFYPSLSILSFFSCLASCNYWRWGSGGSQENINAICILALNIINDKVSIEVSDLILTTLQHSKLLNCVRRFFSYFGGGFFSLLLLALFVFSTEVFSAGLHISVSWKISQFSILSSPRLRFHLLNMRLNRYFKKSTKIEKIERYIKQCNLGDW